VENSVDSTQVRAMDNRGGTGGNSRDLTERKKVDAALAESELKYRMVVENAAEGIVVAQNGFIRFVNPKILEITGYSESEMLSIPFAELIHLDDRDILRAHHMKRMQGDDTPHTNVFRTVHKNGNVKWVEQRSVPITWNGQRAALSLITEVADRKQVEEALRTSEEKYRLILETIADGYYEVDLKGTLVLINDSLCDIMGYARHELQGINYKQLMEPSEIKRVYEAFNAVYRTGLSNPGFVYRVNRKEGTQREVSVSISSIKDSDGQVYGFRGIFRDVTDRRRAEDKIKASLREKEILLREIHHRVKNNLAVISSLLRLQSRYARDEFHREMFCSAQDRIRSMALAHEKLYQSETLANLNIREYILSLVNHLTVSIGRLGIDVECNEEIDDISIGLENAVPLGFILTELISNCFKHAFPGKKTGRISISLHNKGNDTIELVVKDNGIGLREDISLDPPRSLGLDLVRIFVHQLMGKIEITGDEGTETRVTFGISGVNTRWQE
jgi:PAS domain S-box-containing protein